MLDVRAGALKTCLRPDWFLGHQSIPSDLEDGSVCCSHGSRRSPHGQISTFIFSIIYDQNSIWERQQIISFTLRFIWWTIGNSVAQCKAVCIVRKSKVNTTCSYTHPYSKYLLSARHCSLCSGMHEWTRQIRVLPACHSHTRWVRDSINNKHNLF